MPYISTAEGRARDSEQLLMEANRKRKINGVATISCLRTAAGEREGAWSLEYISSLLVSPIPITETGGVPVPSGPSVDGR